MNRWLILVFAVFLFVVATAVLSCEDNDDDDDDNDDNDDNDDDEFVVLSVQPASGPVEGGTNVVVLGRGFVEGATLYFGDAEGDDVEFTSATELSATTPPAPDDQAGFVTVKVENPDGEYAELENGFRYGEPGVSVDWCVLKYPESTTTAPNAPSEPIYGQVYVEGCTETAGSPCGSVTAQVGHGPAGADPSLDPSLFSWTDAEYNSAFAPEDGSEEANNDEYMAQITEDEEGTYKYAYRMSGDGGATWTYCDLDPGSEDGFSPSMMGTLTVAEVNYTIGWCILQYPSSTYADAGSASESIYGRVYVEGCTDGDAFCPGIMAEVGYGEPGDNPATDPGSFTWVTAGYNNEHVDDNNDEYLASITEGSQGYYAYAYRFSGDGGTSWTYCDLDGLDNGFATSQMGALGVGVPIVEIDWCILQYPAATTTNVGDPTEEIYGRVYVEGVTGMGSASDAIYAELGWGAAGADPTADPGVFDWLTADFNVSVSNDDEYQQTITPDSAGTFSYVYRFSGTGGVRWTYCDLDGTDNGFATDQMGALTVNAE